MPVKHVCFTGWYNNQAIPFIKPSHARAGEQKYWNNVFGTFFPADQVASRDVHDKHCMVRIIQQRLAALTSRENFIKSDRAVRKIVNKTHE